MIFYLIDKLLCLKVVETSLSLISYFLFNISKDKGNFQLNMKTNDKKISNLKIKDIYKTNNY